MSEISIRAARASDAEAIATIYNQGIEDRIATLETELRSPAERRDWIAARGPRHPVIVAEAVDDGPATGRARAGDSARATVVGWGSLNSYNPRAAYQHVADFSIYVERGWRGRGVGHRLLERLIELARALGYHKMMLSAFPFNEAGVALYERMGFTMVGICHEMGLLDGKWIDTIIMEKLL
jgi:L-amino acid N-acyltransferase YncA